MKLEINQTTKAQEVTFVGVDLAKKESVTARVVVKVEKDGKRLMKPFPLLP